MLGEYSPHGGRISTCVFVCVLTRQNVDKPVFELVDGQAGAHKPRGVGLHSRQFLSEHIGNDISVCTYIQSMDLYRTNQLVAIYYSDISSAEPKHHLLSWRYSTL